MAALIHRCARRSPTTKARKWRCMRNWRNEPDCGSTLPIPTVHGSVRHQEHQRIATPAFAKSTKISRVSLNPNWIRSHECSTHARDNRCDFERLQKCFLPLQINTNCSGSRCCNWTLHPPHQLFDRLEIKTHQPSIILSHMWNI